MKTKSPTVPELLRQYKKLSANEAAAYKAYELGEIDGAQLGDAVIQSEFFLHEIGCNPTKRTKRFFKQINSKCP